MEYYSEYEIILLIFFLTFFKKTSIEVDRLGANWVNHLIGKPLQLIVLIVA